MWINKTISLDDTLPIAIFGGVYSNLEALQAFKASCEAMNIPASQVICTGDIVAYCADPMPCIEMIQSWGIHSIAGNVEIQLRNREEDCGCNFQEDSRCDIFSRHWYPYAQEQVTEEALSWMESLPHHITFQAFGKRFKVVHGTLEDVSGYLFASSPDARFHQQFKSADADFILAGHCGLPFHKKFGGGDWLNAGVIGMPANDRTQRTWYVTLEGSPSISPTIRFHTLSFLAENTRQKMLDRGLPRAYADTLLSGLWDNCEILPATETALQGMPIRL